MHYIVAKQSKVIPPIHKYPPNNTQIPAKFHPNTQIPSKQGFDTYPKLTKNIKKRKSQLSKKIPKNGLKCLGK